MRSSSPLAPTSRSSCSARSWSSSSYRSRHRPTTPYDAETTTSRTISWRGIRSATAALVQPIRGRSSKTSTVPTISPRMPTIPEVGWICAEHSCIRVVLPAPFGPRMTQRSSSSTVQSTPESSVGLASLDADVGELEYGVHRGPTLHWDVVSALPHVRRADRPGWSPAASATSDPTRSPTRCAARIPATSSRGCPASPSWTLRRAALQAARRRQPRVARHPATCVGSGRTRGPCNVAALEAGEAVVVGDVRAGARGRRADRGVAGAPGGPGAVGRRAGDRPRAAHRAGRGDPAARATSTWRRGSRRSPTCC